MQTGYVYRLCCTDVSVREQYIGSTMSLHNRKHKHKAECIDVAAHAHDLPVYQCIRFYGGWMNWTMVVIEKVEFREKSELRARERFWIEQMHPALNVDIPLPESLDEQKQRVIVVCGCGSRLGRTAFAKHRRTKKHLAYLAVQDAMQAAHEQPVVPATPGAAAASEELGPVAA